MLKFEAVHHFVVFLVWKIFAIFTLNFAFRYTKNLPKTLYCIFLNEKLLLSPLEKPLKIDSPRE